MTPPASSDEFLPGEEKGEVAREAVARVLTEAAVGEQDILAASRRWTTTATWPPSANAPQTVAPAKSPAQP